MTYIDPLPRERLYWMVVYIYPHATFYKYWEQTSGIWWMLQDLFGLMREGAD